MATFKKGDIIYRSNFTERTPRIIGIVINSQKAVLIKTTKRGAFEITNEQIPEGMTLAQEPEKIFTMYELKMALATGLCTLGMPNPFITN